MGKNNVKKILLYLYYYMSYSFNSTGYTLSNYLQSSINTIGYIGATGGTFTATYLSTAGVSLYTFRNVSTLYVTPGVWLVNCSIDGSTGDSNFFSSAISTNGLTTWSNQGIAGYTFMTANLGNTILAVSNRFNNSGSLAASMAMSAIRIFSQGTTSLLSLSIATNASGQYFNYYFKCVRIA
jgi:hypothetical protein